MQEITKRLNNKNTDIQGITNNIEKDEILHIGDNIHEDYEAAKDFGFNAAFLNRVDNKDNYIYQKHEFVFNSLLEVLLYLYLHELI